MFYEFCEAKGGMVLFATDVAARGLDFPSVDWVVQVRFFPSVGWVVEVRLFPSVDWVVQVRFFPSVDWVVQVRLPPGPWLATSRCVRAPRLLLLLLLLQLQLLLFAGCMPSRACPLRRLPPR